MDDDSLDATQDFVAAQLRQLRAVPKRSDAALRAGELLTGNDRLSPAEQLEIYRQQFWLRHTAALLEDYPGVSGILGQAQWEALAESYLSEIPPQGWTLRDLGASLAEHVARREQTPDQALCVDMARLEWAYTEVFDAAESPALDASKLESIPQSAWETAVIALAPALRVLKLQYPVAELRRELRASQDDPHGAPVAIPAPDPHHLVVFRSPSRVLRYVRVDAPAGELLRQLQLETPLTAACERVAEMDTDWPDVVEANVGGWFAQWTQRRWIVDVKTH
jgi:hypothetical protein